MCRRLISKSHLQRSPRIALTRILPARFVASAQKYVRYKLISARLQEHGFTTIVAHNRHQYLLTKYQKTHLTHKYQSIKSACRPNSHLLQDRRQRSALAQPTPACHRCILTDQQMIVLRQTDWRNMRCKLQRCVQLHQRQIVFVRKEIVLGMDDLAVHSAFDVRQLLLDVREIVLADTDAYLRVEQTAGAEKKGAKWILIEEHISRHRGILYALTHRHSGQPSRSSAR